MGWFTYKCPNHGDFKVVLNKREKIYECPVCKEVSRPVIRAGTTQILEKMDNGAMGRAVERIHNIEEIMDDRSRSDDERFKDQRGIEDEEDPEES